MILVSGITKISATGIEFVTKCMDEVETRGTVDFTGSIFLHDYIHKFTIFLMLSSLLLLLLGITNEGVYRVGGVSSKFNKLLANGIGERFFFF